MRHCLLVFTPQTQIGWKMIFIADVFIFMLSIFQCLQRKKAHYKTLHTLPSLPLVGSLYSSTIPMVIPSLTSKQSVL